MRAHQTAVWAATGLSPMCCHREEPYAFLRGFLCAANRPAGTREALPGSMIIPPEAE